MTALSFLLQRQSCGQLAAPAPDAEQLSSLFQAALRAPDHGNLKPYRFIVVEGDGLNRLGDIYREALLRKGETDVAKTARAQLLPTRAPMVIVALFHHVESDKTPRQEQLITAGLATAQLINAAQAMGLGAMWRTGELAYDDFVCRQLGGAVNEHIIGFIYIGTPKTAPRTIEPVDDKNFWRRF